MVRWEPDQRGCVPALGWPCNGRVIFCFGEECDTFPSGQEHFILESDLAKEETELLRTIILLFFVVSKP